ncbi:MAG: stage V sporulation protein AC [Oscillospiraceae bacterium]|nr:stage V sporulation protein AC [Oscillospiraceae bacterium]
MKLTNNEYNKLVQDKSPKSPLWRNILLSFLIGGAICAIGQGIKNLFLNNGLDMEKAGLATSVTMVFLGALLTALNLYDKLAKLGGAGTLVPITGFANAVTAPAMEFKYEGIITGVCAKMFTIAGPVIVYSMISSVIYGIVLLFV